MLQELRLSGLGVIDSAVLEPSPGFTAVTGETGAGKTMIVTALGLLTGGRGDAARVRVGADRAIVEARFAGPGPGAVQELVSGVGGRLDEDGAVIAVRTVGAEGRSRAHIGGRAVPVGTLADLTEPLVAVHGQSEAISLLQPSRQRAVLDRYAGVERELTTYRRRRADWIAVRDELADRRARSRERAQREQLLRIALEEIDAVAPRPGEDVDLLAEIRRLENGDSLRVAATTALTGLLGADTLDDQPTAIGLADRARRDLEAAGDGRLQELAATLRQATAVLGDVAAELSGYLTDLDVDPERLPDALTRQAALKGLTRRWGPDVAAVLDWADAARAELADLDTSDERTEALERQCADAETAAAAAASRLTSRRTRAAQRLGTAVTAELTHLAMGRARVAVIVEPRAATAGDRDVLLVDGRAVAAGADGTDRVEILLRAHPGAPDLPIGRGASGGELSRVMLALEVTLADADPVGTLVFDEVDAGVGGRAAIEIGSRLAALARTHQVIVVTHLAQVAAFADHHVVVDPRGGGLVGRSDLKPVQGQAREAELARMLGGDDGPTAQAHARDLLAAAAHRRSGRDDTLSEAHDDLPQVAADLGSVPAAAAAPTAPSRASRPSSAGARAGKASGTASARQRTERAAPVAAAAEIVRLPRRRPTPDGGRVRRAG
ncbi:DNA repair protein RecN [Nakamurella flava]|uniref:DNA repair protein RecN n=1 Tax=Nakamurella flava TaxID=2576308 RepID=A0A4U6Q867_9ACTN|nr:DNA repair protein RecN [Nakamurella flava]TKV56174.1 DNA repair protein RecN [Nakamurella flava]